MMWHGLVRPFVVLAVMLAATAFGVMAVPSAKLSDVRAKIELERAVPGAFGEWRIDASTMPLPLSTDQEEAVRRAYEQILSRTYVNAKNERIMLSIAYGSTQVQGLRVHRQEICYAAQGFQISRLEHSLVTVGGTQMPATRMVATQGSRVEPVTYWFTMGDQAVQTYLERELVQLKYTLAGYIPDGYLVRVSSLSADVPSAYAKQIEFVDALVNHVDVNLRKRLLGGH